MFSETAKEVRGTKPGVATGGFMPHKMVLSWANLGGFWGAVLRRDKSSRKCWLRVVEEEDVVVIGGGMEAARY